MVFPVEVALRFELEFGHTVVGVAETADGAAGPPDTVTATDTLLTLTQPPALNASAKKVVVVNGFTSAFAPLALVPKFVPPVA
jgi:hypothetical protein